MRKEYEAAWKFANENLQHLQKIVHDWSNKNGFIGHSDWA
jgi:hypothetical protein